MAKSPPEGTKLIAKNRKAFHDFEFVEELEAGLVLQGTEVKVLRDGKVSFGDAHVRIKGDEAWLHDLHIPEYKNGSWTNHVPTRPRKLLLHRREIGRLKIHMDRKGLSIVPLDLHFRRGYAKVKLGVGKGRKRHDKREALKKKQDKRDMDRAQAGR
ncbi:MAG: SsrA-binding protein SmpB [Planctomycetes bacterium]|nr:SsrA-binding protein SmpB [Planctomycetota bacterium]